MFGVLPKAVKRWGMEQYLQKQGYKLDRLSINVTEQELNDVVKNSLMVSVPAP